MSRFPRHMRLLLLLVLACALPAGSAQAADTRYDNMATAVVQEDQGRAFDFAWDLSRQRGGAVRHVNSAEARASCVGCQATAIAFQVVLAWGSPNPVVPQNLAVAINDGCTDCLAAAHARQFVRVLDAPVKITGAGRAALADVREDLRALEERDLPVGELYQAVEQQESRIRAVLNHELVLKSDSSAEPEVLDRELLQAGDIG